jgi:hypothetical protein
MESEKKLKILSIMKVVTCGKNQITLKDFITGCQTEIDSLDLNPTDNICLTPFLPLLKDCDSITIAMQKCLE